jgi:hypothetical protein
MTIHLNEGDSIEIILGEQTMKLTVESKETSRMEFNSLEYSLHEGYIFS